MKITITREFQNAEDAIDFLAAVGAYELPEVTTTAQGGAPLSEPTGGEATGGAPAVVKRPRKPRSDAGQPRGPYKKGDDTPPVTTAAAPATVPAAPVPAEPVPAAPAAAAPAPAAPAAPKELTVDDVKAAMTVLAKKHGIEANIKQLALFGVEKVSLLPKEKYAPFIEAVKKAAGVS